MAASTRAPRPPAGTPENPPGRRPLRRAPRWGFRGFARLCRPRARVAAAIAHLGRAEGTGRSVRTPCAFPCLEGQ
jgi:hypothetical protein